MGGPCYRCIFPKPPPAESVLSCSEGGILGPVVGTMGVLQALEAIKLLTAEPTDRETNDSSTGEPMKPSMLIFSAFSNPQFRSVRLRSRRSNCTVCSATPSITQQSLENGSLDYVAFCGVTAPVHVLPLPSRISAKELAGLPQSRVVIDVRDETQYAMCALRGSVNVPWTGNGKTWLDRAKQKGVLDRPNGEPTYFVCRFGNDSQLAARAILDDAGNGMVVRDVIGGFQSWRRDIDAEWPDY